MTTTSIEPADKKNIRWAAAREFDLLPPVDSAFSPENMSLFRRLLLRHLVLPQNYRRHLQGWISYSNEARSGYIFARKGPQSFFIESLGVLPDFRRNGVGSELVAEVEKFAVKAELAFTGASLTNENTAGLAFFNSLGYAEYRASLLVGEAEDLNFTPEGDKVLRELKVKDIVPTYDKWLRKALVSGDGAFEDVVWDEHRKMALKTTARHWAVYDEDQEIGYLRISGLTNEMTVYLSCSPEYWASDKQWAWIREAVDDYPFPPNTLKIDLASTQHFEEAAKILAQWGFRQQGKGRFLLFKRL